MSELSNFAIFGIAAAIFMLLGATNYCESLLFGTMFTILFLTVYFLFGPIVVLNFQWWRKNQIETGL
jgi:hypothetical protein